MLNLRPLLLAGICALGLSAPAGADVLLIEHVREAPPNDPAGLQRPVGGMSMAQVEQRFGPPRARGIPIGDPPISRWDYDGFSVFFEHTLVLHSVIHRTAER